MYSNVEYGFSIYPNLRTGVSGGNEGMVGNKDS